MAGADSIADAAASLERRVAATIADMRGRRGLSQAGLAELLGVPAACVARLEGGEATSLATLAEIACRLDFHVTLGLHDRQAPVPAAAPGPLTPELSTVSPAAPGLAAGAGQDGAHTLSGEPPRTFVLEEPGLFQPAAAPAADIVWDGGDGGFNDGMGG
jgi:transcriptional regulator with XRE-family HTH domain